MPRIDCFGFGCCQAPIISPSFDYFNLKVSALPQRNFTYTMLVDKDWIVNKSKDFDLSDSICAKAQVVLDWIIQDLPVKDPSYANSSCVNKTTSAHGAGGYVCRCKDGFYEGNPYLPNGCQVVKECEGCVDQCILLPNHSFGCGKKGSATTLFVGLGLGIGSMLAILGAYWLYRVMKRKRNSKLKANNFERNGGLLLKQKILSSNNKTEKIKIFNSDELDKATDEYNEERILGRGGQGTVYKGCCLESEVPMLVYEYVPCGTLSQHIHASKQEIPMPWEMRLQIGTDIANALAYLHSSYFVPIFHRDIKSSNILLDEKYRAKLSDFGISKSVTVDQTHFTTDHIVGTYGYLDPEYFISNRFTDKSDVFSFGVVLVELLTGQKAIRSEKDERGLAAWFLRHIGDSKLYETLDARVVKEGKEKEIMGVAQLAKRCLSMDGKGRPAMKEVAAELETIRSSLQHGLARNQSFISVEFNDSQPSSSIDISLEE
ncbi:putative wall-associated receptor kinase-like 11 [Bienertia sinuspersici]